MPEGSQRRRRAQVWLLYARASAGALVLISLIAGILLDHAWLVRTALTAIATISLVRFAAESKRRNSS